MKFISRLLIVVLLAVLPLAAVGCATVPPQTLVKQSTELATVVALERMDADIQDTENLVSLAVTVKALTEGQEVDIEALKQKILVEVMRNFEGKSSLAISLLASDIFEIVSNELRANGVNAFDVNGELKIYVDAAINGVKSGATLYKLALENY